MKSCACAARAAGALLAVVLLQPRAVGRVIAAGSSAVYAGGDFTTINGATAMRVASVNGR